MTPPDSGKDGAHHVAGGNVKGSATLGTVWQFLRKLNMPTQTTKWLSNCTLDIFSKEMRAYFHTKTWTQKFTVVLFIIDQTWKQPRCPSTEEWLNKQWSLHAMEHYETNFNTHAGPHEYPGNSAERKKAKPSRLDAEWFHLYNIPQLENVFVAIRGWGWGWGGSQRRQEAPLFWISSTAPLTASMPISL